MEIAKALDLMGFTRLDDVTVSGVKKRYRVLMQEHHPDLYFSDIKLLEEKEILAKEINEAKEYLQTLAQELETIREIEKAGKRTEIFAVIPFDRLCAIYKGESVTLRQSESGETYEINSKNIKANSIKLFIECIISYGDSKYRFNTIKSVAINDCYAIECEIPVEELSSIKEVEVRAYGKVVNLKLENKNTELGLKFEDGITLKILVKQRIVNGGQ